MPKIKSLKQARFFGFIAGGGKPKRKTSLTRSKAREMLRGAHLKKMKRK